MINKISHVQQLVFLFLVLSVALHYRARNNTDPTFPGQVAVLLQIRFPLVAQTDEVRILGFPVGKVVFRKDSEFSALGSGGSDKVCCFIEIVIELHGLYRGQ